MSTPDQQGSDAPATPTPGPQGAAGPQLVPGAQQGYYLPPQPAPHPYGAGWPTQQPAPGASGSRRGLATTAIILGALPLLGDLLQPFVLTSMVTSGGYAVYSMVALALSILSLLLGIGALVCGLIARRDAPLPAGIGIGLGTAVLVGGISSLLYGVIAIF